MDRVVLDQALRSKLNGLTRDVELCDENGQTVGHFVPESLYRQLLVAWSKIHLSDEELARRQQEPRGRTLHEILSSLGQS